MGVRILVGRERGTYRGDEQAVLFSSSTGWAFGPVFESEDQADQFLKWLDGDPRRITDSVLESKYQEFLRTQTAVRA